MCLYANGQSVPAKPLQPKFSSNTYIEAYQTLFSWMNIDGKDAGIVCSCNDYPKGYTLVVFDFRSGGCFAADGTETGELAARDHICRSITRGY